jgi:hypothetical protein
MPVILGVYGLIAVALNISVVVNFYSEVKSLPDNEEEDRSLSEEE